MPLTVIATAGAATANSYVTVAEADAFLDGRLNAGAWSATDADTRAKAVVEATRELDALPWAGSRVSTAQALNWPRAYVLDPDAPWDVETTGIDDRLYIAETVIPPRVKDATIELALQFVKAGTSDLAALDGDAGLVAKTVGPLAKAWGALGKPQGLARFPRAAQRLRPLLAGGGTMTAARQ